MPNATIALILVLGLASTAPARDADSDKMTVRGITISTHGSGRDWGSDAIVPTMEDIRDLGANWVSIHPYASISADGSLRWRPIDPKNPPDYLVRPIREAHRLGLSICIKPHIAYWGSTFSWRGEITFQNDEEWERFWRDYGEWIALLATVCQEADGFVIGTELDRMLSFEDQWRAIIADVRQRTDAPLTYAANWTDYHRVPFWDALDVIGIQAYFPLTDKADYSEEDIHRGWATLMAELGDYADEHHRNILFTELGYNQSHQAPIKPWTFPVDGEDALAVQITCLRTALAAIAAEPRVVGALLWKWFPNPRPVGRNFQLATPPLKRVISKAWLNPR
jgi:hypothetical protein